MKIQPAQNSINSLNKKVSWSDQQISFKESTSNLSQINSTRK